jgi:hypothetical protein
VGRGESTRERCVQQDSQRHVSKLSRVCVCVWGCVWVWVGECGCVCVCVCVCGGGHFATAVFDPSLIAQTVIVFSSCLSQVVEQHAHGAWVWFVGCGT